MELIDIINECNRLSDMMNVKFNIPVRINNRLTRTLGRVCYECGKPYVMEISGPMLKTCADESIIQVVKHEWAHWYAWRKTGEIHGHDALFRDICESIGCDHDRAKNHVERLQGTAPVYKYTVSCPGCGASWNYARKGHVIKYLDTCWCSNCGCADLKLKQNW